jgi:HK97 gp10 family phage protein
MADKIVSCKIIGLGDLEDKLQREVPLKIANKILRDGLRKGAKIMLDAMIRLVPKKSGFLSKNLDIRTKVSTNAVSGAAFIGPKGKVKYPDGQEMAAVSVARYLEFGHRTRGKGGRGTGIGKVSPKPFMTPAFEQTKNQALAALEDSVREALGEVGV